MRYPKHWSDQPDAVTEAEPICRMQLAICQSVEIRRINWDPAYFLTIGNLFGSQTVKVPSADIAFRILDRVTALEEGETMDIKKWPRVEIIEGVTS